MTKQSQRIIALITDFGQKGLHYVASMKGVILGINPEVKIIDVDHNITPFSIFEAAYILRTVYTYFPENTIFIIVVDPGVGSSRELLAIRIVSNQYLIVPNNGIIPLSFSLDKITECINLTNPTYFHEPVSQTFHGRDIMAPIAAYISKGLALKQFGTKFNLSELILLENYLNINQKGKIIECTIQYIDTFGNCTTNIIIKNHRIQNTSIDLTEGMEFTLNYGSNMHVGKYYSYFKAVHEKDLIFIKGSSDFLEISINQGNAANNLGLKVGDVITIRF
jgi:S-adenosylmethionine hydrolase